MGVTGLTGVTQYSTWFLTAAQHTDHVAHSRALVVRVHFQLYPEGGAGGADVVCQVQVPLPLAWGGGTAQRTADHFSGLDTI